MQTWPVPIDGNNSFSSEIDDISTALQTQQSNFSGAASPASPVAGQFFFDTDDNKLYVRKGDGNWYEVTVSATAANPQP